MKVFDKFEESYCSSYRRFPDSYTAEEVEESFTAATTYADLSREQSQVHQEIMKWVREEPHGMSSWGQVLTLGGHAGTGKTTLLGVLACTLADKRVAYCTLTGRAASILRKKLDNSGAFALFVGTLHSLLYKAIEDDRTGAITGYRKRDPQRIAEEYDLIVVDEASMVDPEMAEDLCAPGLPVLAVGDHGQLAPIGGISTWMVDPCLKLEQIHRQAEGSPIISLATHVRKTQSLDNYKPDGAVVDIIRPNQLQDALAAAYAKHTPREVCLLVYSNKLRVTLNELGHYVWLQQAPTEVPKAGAWFIALKNQRMQGIWNGMRAQLLSQIEPKHKHWWRMKLYYPYEQLEVRGDALISQFHRSTTFNDLEDIQRACNSEDLPKWKQVGMLLDYGYALTVHKAQGSQFKHVFLVYERPMYTTKDDFTRWLYTGITRASTRLTLVLNE